MKLEKLQKELETQIKDLILKVLKDFDMSKYIIDVCLLTEHPIIYIRKKDVFISAIHYIDGVIFSQADYSLIDMYFKKKSMFDIDKMVDFVNSESIQIIKTLYYNKSLLETELKNILE